MSILEGTVSHSLCGRKYFLISIASFLIQTCCELFEFKFENYQVDKKPTKNYLLENSYS